MALLHMSIFDFLAHTPVEIDYALKAYYDYEVEKSKTDWERFRTLIYYTYMFTPSSRRKVTYDVFKKDYLSFGFDEKKEPAEVITDEKFMQIMDVMQKLKGES